MIRAAQCLFTCKNKIMHLVQFSDMQSHQAIMFYLGQDSCHGWQQICWLYFCIISRSFGCRCSVWALSMTRRQRCKLCVTSCVACAMPALSLRPRHHLQTPAHPNMPGFTPHEPPHHPSLPLHQAVVQGYLRRNWGLPIPPAPSEGARYARLDLTICQLAPGSSAHLPKSAPRDCNGVPG